MVEAAASLERSVVIIAPNSQHRTSSRNAQTTKLFVYNSLERDYR
jgi:hypothetical protein